MATRTKNTEKARCQKEAKAALALLGKGWKISALTSETSSAKICRNKR